MKKWIITLAALVGWMMPAALSAQQVRTETEQVKAQAPSWVIAQRDSAGVALIDPLAAQLAWTQPMLTAPTEVPTRITYTLRIVEVMPQQHPDLAIERNPVIYQKKGLLTTHFTFPRNILRRDIQPGHLYVAQVTANVEPLAKTATPMPTMPGQQTPLQPVMGGQNGQPAKNGVPTTAQLIQNDGKSELLLFKMKE